MKKLLQNKKLIALYLVWCCIHTFLLLQGFDYEGYRSDFWPLTDHSSIYTYDISEWFVYTVSPIVLIYIIANLNNNTTTLLLCLLLFSNITKGQITNINDLISDGITPGFGSDNLPPVPPLTPIHYNQGEVRPKKKHRKKNTTIEGTTNVVNPEDDPFSDLKSTFHQQETQAQYYQSETPTPTPVQYFSGDISRFTNSPCYSTLGYNPGVSREEQEERYTACENEIRKEEGKKGLLIAGIVIGIGLLVFVGIRNSKSEQTPTT